ncbi:CAZyme family GH135 [Penicillium roqueforti]|nr:CAZyme family GH135 [Penicillium roqueforti]
MFQLLSVIATLFTLASTAISTGLLVPLYAWPGTDKWNTLYDSIAAHPSIPFYLIINPSTGPGDTEYPEDVFITAIAKLNSYPNTKILGYTYTNQGTRDSSEIEKDIAIYAKWASYAGQNITLSGTFFDEAANGEDPSKLAYFENLSRKSKSGNLTTVIFNPGVKLVADVAKWFAAADFIVEYENTYASWVASAPDDRFSTPDNYGRDAVILNQTPEDANIDNVVRLAKDMGLGAIYLASDDNYMNLTTVTKVAGAVAQNQIVRRRGYRRFQS